MTNKRMWMVRAGKGAESLEDFIEKGIVAIGGDQVGDIKPGESRKEISKKLIGEDPNRSKSNVALNTGQLYRYLNEIKIGDKVITYDPSRRIYHVGEITSDPVYKPELIAGLPRVRNVKWIGEVSRDLISTSTRNTLGAISTLFLLSTEATDEITARLEGKKIPEVFEHEEESEVTEDIAKDLRKNHGNSSKIKFHN